MRAGGNGEWKLTGRLLDQPGTVILAARGIVVAFVVREYQLSGAEVLRKAVQRDMKVEEEGEEGGRMTSYRQLPRC